MHALGSPLVYRVPEARHTKTIKHDKTEVTGSIYHPELTEFAGLVVAVKLPERPGGDHVVDIVIFPPNRNPVTINDVPEEDMGEPGAAPRHHDAPEKDLDESGPARHHEGKKKHG